MTLPGAGRKQEWSQTGTKRETIRTKSDSEQRTEDRSRSPEYAVDPDRCITIREARWASLKRWDSGEGSGRSSTPEQAPGSWSQAAPSRRSTAQGPSSSPAIDGGEPGGRRSSPKILFPRGSRKNETGPRPPSPPTWFGDPSTPPPGFGHFIPMPPWELDRRGAWSGAQFSSPSASERP